MKKFLLTLCTILPILYVFGQSPGGVASPAAWYRADAMVYSDAGTTSATNNVPLYQWNDYIGSGRNLIQTNSARRPIYSNQTTLANFNPTVTFTRANVHWMECDPGAGNEIINRSSGTFYSAGFMDIDYLGTGLGAGLLGFNSDMDNPGLHTSNNSMFNLLMYSENGANYTPVSTNAFVYKNSFIAGASWQNGASTTSPATYGATTISLNGVKTFYSGDNFRNANTSNAWRDFRIGGDTDLGSHNGQLNEILIYQNILTAQEKNRLESYLAIKYGTTLEDNYVNSTNGIVWNFDATYQNNVFGIAHDATGALYQKQSRSENNNQKLIIGAGSSLFNTNAANTNILTDGQFLLVGDNGLKQRLSVPFVYTAGTNGETNYRFEAVWKVQNTNGVGSVTIAWPKSFNNMYLVQSSDQTFASGNTLTPMTTEITVNGEVYNTATITLGDGQFFTFAGYAHAPGGVMNNLSYWYRADINAANTGAGTDVTTWTDYFSGAVLSQMTTNPLPKYVEGATNYFNFNPGINFTDRDQSLGNMSVQTISQLEFDIFTFTKEGLSENGGNPRIFSSLVDNNLPAGNISRWDGIGILQDNRLERVNNAYGSRYLGNPGGTFSTTIPSIMYHKFTDVNLSKSLNGAADGPLGTHGARGFMNGGHAFGSTVFTPDNGSDNRGFIGHLGEAIIYGAGNLTAEERRRVDSYMAIKYGITLDRVATDHYLDSNAQIVWSGTTNTGYNNNIFGIANDELSALHQKQSKSVNANQKMIIGAGNSLADTNAANINNLALGQYLIIGDNGLRQGLSTPLAYTAGTNGEVNFRFESIWKVQNTGTVGPVTVAWPKGIQNFYLVQSPDEIFDSGDTFTPMTTEVTVNGVVYNTATVTLGNGQFFTFAGYGHAPGGVVNSLSYWYRADKDAVNAGAGTDVTSWTDYFSGTVVSQMTTNPLPKYVDGAANYFNFNPGINFTNRDQSLGNMSVQTISQLEFDIFTFTKEGLSENGGNPRIFSSLVDNNLPAGNISRWDGIGILQDNRLERVNNAYGSRYLGNPGGTFSTTIPSIMYHKFTDVNLSKSLNGAADGPLGTHGARGFMNGGHAFGSTVFTPDNDSDNRGFLGHLGETIIYGAGNLTAEERRRVDSYMAIKYGITLGRVGTDHYLGSTASPTSIVWSGTLNAAYNNNIFGIARTDIAGFEQKVSKSVNSGTILTIAKDNDFVSTNLAPSRTGLPVNEGYLLLGDNNNTSTVPYTPTEIGDCGEIIGATDEIKLIPRKWLVQRTSSVGATYIQANLAAYTADLNTDIKMYIADDENFTQNVVAISGAQDGNNWVFPYNFDNDNTARYITFGGKFVAAPCEQCKGGTYTLRTGYQWNQGAWANQAVNAKENVLLGNDADGNPLYASMYADYSANPSIEYNPARYPRQYSGRWTTSRRYDNTNTQVQHRIQLTKAMKASFQISNINTYRNNKNNFQVIGYCNGVAVMPKITYAYNTSYHTFDISGNQTIGTMSWRGFVPNVSTANVRFDRPVEQIVIICSVDRVNTDKTLRSILYSDITLECAEVVPPTPDNVYVSHSYTQETLATCGGNTTMRIKVTNNNICDNKTIDLHQALPAGLVYVPGSFNGNDLPAGAMTGATLTYTGGNLELSGLSLPSGEHWMYVDVANPGVVGTYPTQFTYEVTNGIDPANTYSSSVVNLNYYQSADPVQSAPALTLSIKDNVICGTNNMVMTYRMKIDNPNTTSITGAEILHMFDHDQVIQTVTYVTGEDEDGVITGSYPVDGIGTTIDPVNNNLFNLVDAIIPVGVSYIDITVNTGNSYDIPDVQTSGISSTFLVGFGSGECAESGESTSNEVVLPICTATTVCYKPGIAPSAGNPALPTKAGITSLNRAGAQDADNWPMVRNGGWLALESKTKGFVINRVAFTDADSNPATPEVPVGIPAADFTEGMMVYDTTNKCLKIYTSVNNGTSYEWHCLSTQACPD